MAPISRTHIAWNAWSNVGYISGCNTSGENCDTGFIYNYTYNATTIADTSFTQGAARFEAAAQAQAVAQPAPTETFTLPVSESLNFRIGDINSDNNFVAYPWKYTSCPDWINHTSMTNKYFD